MTPTEMEYILNNNITLIYDSREHQTAALEKRLRAAGFKHRREALKFGDYTAEYVIGDKVFNLQNEIVVERKMSLDEICGNFTKGRKRFEREFERAKENNATIYLLVEDANWENLINGKYNTKFNSKAFFASITAWMARYDIKVIFCKSETSGKMIKEILYRELKERLENGKYG